MEYGRGKPYSLIAIMVAAVVIASGAILKYL